MESDTVIPLNPQIIRPCIFKGRQQKILKVKPKGPVMSLMDTLLTLLIVSPLIVGQWRGTWTLMDVYERAFPPWESFLFGTTLHLSFAIMREGLQDLIKFKKTNWLKLGVAFFLRRLYTYFFAFACIMNWRGGWIIFDEWLGLELFPDGRTVPGKNISLTTAVFVICLIFLGALRSFKNILAAPFVIGLDTKTTAFDFPTRYRIKISYTTVYAINNNRAVENKNSDRRILNLQAEKLTRADRTTPHVVIEKQIVEHISPRPFINDLRGASPSGFSPSMILPTTPAYPKLQTQRNPNQPHNIQDIIQYISENAHRQKEILREEHRFPSPSHREREKFKLYGAVQSPSRTLFSKQRFPQDPFFAYKPQDPSDINLLAPSSFRFAPTILTPGYNKNRQQQILQEAENVANNPVGEEFKKPLSLTLNIYSASNENDFGEGDGRITFQGPGITPRYKYPSFFSGIQRNRNVAGPGKMVVRLNVFPGQPNIFTREEADSPDHKFEIGNHKN